MDPTIRLMQARILSTHTERCPCPRGRRNKRMRGANIACGDSRPQYMSFSQIFMASFGAWCTEYRLGICPTTRDSRTVVRKLTRPPPSSAGPNPPLTGSPWNAGWLAQLASSLVPPIDATMYFAVTGSVSMVEGACWYKLRKGFAVLDTIVRFV
ncbi:hypothetical protein LZ31DRAFT_305819 [Colletotrichum somersetense]|nr:hypothetical protein LZ31DRAFT_305819 [Colletotrichum somersetense]